MKGAPTIVAIPDDSWLLDTGGKEPRTSVEWPRVRPEEHTPTAILATIDELVWDEAAHSIPTADDEYRGWEMVPRPEDFDVFMRALGTWLFEQLPDAAQEELLRAIKSGRPTRLVFHDVGEPMGQGLPWEYLAAPVACAEPVFIGMHSCFSILRSRRPPVPEPRAAAETFSLLVVPIGVQPTRSGLAFSDFRYLPLEADLGMQLKPLPIECIGPHLLRPDNRVRSQLVLCDSQRPSLFRRTVYHPHGAIEISGGVVMTTSEYTALGGSLAYSLALSLAFGHNLVIVGMSLADEYLRQAIAQWRRDVQDILWFTDQVISAPDEAWLEDHRITRVPVVDWRAFWAAVRSLPAPSPEEVARAWNHVLSGATRIVDPEGDLGAVLLRKEVAAEGVSEDYRLMMLRRLVFSGCGAAVEHPIEDLAELSRRAHAVETEFMRRLPTFG